MLIPISNLVQKSKLVLNLMQCVTAITTLFLMILIGVSIEKLILDEAVSVLWATVILSCIVAISLLLFFILIQFSVHNKTVEQRTMLETKLDYEEIKMRETLQWSKSVKTLRHDLNNHLIFISDYIKNGNEDKALQYINRITEKINKIPQYVNTENPAVNAVLDLKRMVCEKENIDLKCYIENSLPEFDDVTFCSIFGNLIDNAIEAEINEEQKEIRLSLKSAGDYLHITIQNRIHKPVLKNGAIPRTSKKDKKNHGIGLDSAIETIIQINGVIDFQEQNDWFIVDMLIPFI